MPSPTSYSTVDAAVEAKILIFHQESFSGGMNQQVDPTRIANTEYPLLINGRTRYGNIEPINLPVNADTQGQFEGMNIQGIYSASPFFVVFASGRAYYRDLTSSVAAFTQIAGFVMDSDVEHIYAEAVPISSLNFARQLVSADSNTSGINYLGVTAGSPQCLVCQDGINQARLIFPDGSARVSGTYANWTQDNREYIPIGRQMMYLNGVLYVAMDIMNGSQVLRGRQIGRSVTGRPLDFVINIDVNGDKGGDASTTSLAVNSEEVTCIKSVNQNEGGFFVGTANNSFLVIPLFNGSLPFNEPTFRIQPLFNTGPLNNFSLCDIVGDTSLIDFGGIRSFNATLQTRNEGRNLPFSKKISLLFATIVQDTSTASISFDDYALFAVNTIYGRAIILYDTITQTWVGLDIYNDFIPIDVAITQFCEVKVGITRRLFVRTSDDLIFELFAGTKPAIAQVFLGEWCSNDAKLEQRLKGVKLVFTDIEQDGEITVTPYGDRKAFTAVVQPVLQTNAAFTPPIAVPFGSSAADTVRNINFNLDADVCWKLGFLVSWNIFANLSHIRVESQKIKATEVTDEQAALVYS